MKVIKFDLEKYADKNICMHCPEEWQAELFCKFLHDAGKRWRNYDSYIDDNMWHSNQKFTVYYFNEGQYGDLYHAKEYRHKVLEISDFIFDEDDK